jgi:hypothetical protein
LIINDQHSDIGPGGEILALAHHSVATYDQMTQNHPKSIYNGVVTDTFARMIPADVNADEGQNQEEPVQNQDVNIPENVVNMGNEGLEV